MDVVVVFAGFFLFLVLNVYGFLITSTANCVIATHLQVEFVAFLMLGALFHLALFIGPGTTHVHVHHW